MILGNSAEYSNISYLSNNIFKAVKFLNFKKINIIDYEMQKLTRGNY